MHTCSPAVPHRTSQRGMGPSETSENKGDTCALTRLGSDIQALPYPSIPSQSIPRNPPDPWECLYTPTDHRVRTSCTLSLQGCRIPAPGLVIHLLPCPASPCCLPSDTRCQHVDDSYIILGLPPRSDSRFPDGGYNKSRTSRTFFSTACRRRLFPHIHLRIPRTPLFTGCDCLPTPKHPHQQAPPQPGSLTHQQSHPQNRHTGCTHLHAQPTPPRRNQLWFPNGVYQGHHRP